MLGTSRSVQVRERQAVVESRLRSISAQQCTELVLSVAVGAASRREGRSRCVETQCIAGDWVKSLFVFRFYPPQIKIEQK
ncbi:hypothetical protein [Nostoc sp. LEGE 12450]|uniref:hypothetical protein n=1 Tax=Nostoc sp. LEGE 12450 TaxID=1828643 RepID=UPI001880B7CD|nr:hypothetical protein [Nostoc sp. LEGE 12450]MBE8986901.1 hypothetical protein [Nostoc sp. LEGE 12450]